MCARARARASACCSVIVTNSLAIQSVSNSTSLVLLLLSGFFYADVSEDLGLKIRIAKIVPNWLGSAQQSVVRLAPVQI